MKTRRLAVLVGTEGAYGRQILRGAAAYARSKDGWVCQFRRLDRRTVEELRQWDPHGVIAELSSASVLEKIRRLRRPTVDVGLCFPDTRLPTVGVDNKAVGAAAALHFLHRGFRHFGYVGYVGLQFAKDREAGFRDTVKAAGCTCSSISVDASPWGVTDKLLGRWIETLNKPLAVLTSNDGRGVQFLEAVRNMGLHVPDDLAVMGVDNDALICDLAQPPLSSVALPGEHIGYEAAAQIDRMFAGHSNPTKPILLSPSGIVERQSSDILAIHDPDVAASVRFIRKNAHRPISVAEILREIAISRRSLERRFSQLLGLTLLDEIHRVHVDQAKQLLAQTDLTMPIVAERSGFSNTRQLSTVFRRIAAMTPSGYRRQYRSLGKSVE